MKWVEAEGIETEEISHNDILGWIKEHTKRGSSQKTMTGYLAGLKHYFSHLKASGIIETNPATNIKLQGIKRKTLYDILAPVELEQLYQNYPATDLRGKVMTGLLVYQGLKSAEIIRLEVRDIKLRDGIVCIPEGRKNNERTLPLKAQQILDLQEYLLTTRKEILNQTRKESDHLIVSQSQTGGLGSVLGELAKKLRKRNRKVKNLQHLRASVIVKWLKQYNLREVQYMAGHRYISSTEAYKQNDLDDLIEEIDKYHPLR